MWHKSFNEVNREDLVIIVKQWKCYGLGLYVTYNGNYLGENKQSLSSNINGRSLVKPKCRDLKFFTKIENIFHIVHMDLT